MLSSLVGIMITFGHSKIGRDKVGITHSHRLPQQSRLKPKNEYKTWLPEYSRPPARSAYGWRKEAESVRVINCHVESSLKEDGNRSSARSVSYTLPSSCSATCRKCRDIPYSLFVKDGPGLYLHYNNYRELSLSADGGCCLCWFFVQNLRHVLPGLRRQALHKPIEDEDSHSELNIILGRPKYVQQPGWILLFLGKFATRIYWSLAEDHGAFQESISLFLA